ncbi:MAG: hypothetical protein R3A46_06115 [Thermomicrobiales bacterium]
MVRDVGTTSICDAMSRGTPLDAWACIRFPHALLRTDEADG